RYDFRLRPPVAYHWPDQAGLGGVVPTPHLFGGEHRSFTGHAHWSRALVTRTGHAHWSRALVTRTGHAHWSRDHIRRGLSGLTRSGASHVRPPARAQDLRDLCG